MDGIVGDLKDGVRVIHPHHVLSMSREQALEVLREHGDEQDRHAATLMLAGPALSDADEQSLPYFRPMPSAMRVATMFALNPKLARVCAS